MPFSYAVGLKSFHWGIIPPEGNDECDAPTEGAEPAEFAHVCASKENVDGDSFVCGVIRCLSFLP